MICNWFMLIIVPMMLRGDVIAETARRRPRSGHAHAVLRATASARSKYRSPALVIGRHRQLGLSVGLILGRNDGEFASAILDGRIPELVVLALLVELDAGADTDVVGNVGGRSEPSPIVEAGLDARIADERARMLGPVPAPRVPLPP
jgi:hypothetical protein